MDDTEAAAAAAAAAPPAAAAEGSLPPRKRLLLKSGSNLSEGTPLTPSAMEQPPAAPPADPHAAGVTANPTAGDAAPAADCCSRCGSKDNSMWRRVKKSGVYQRLCNTCTMLYSMNMFCPYCLLVYQDAGQLGDPDVWLNCNQCKRSVHVACEAKNAAGGAVDPNGYTCPECRKSPNGAKTEENATGSDGLPSLKKPRTVKTEEGDAGGTDAADGKPPVTPKASSAAQEALLAAKNAAQQAARAAAAAKATALAKAQAAAKAAIAAKAALDAAAQAARDEIDARAELRRNGVRLEPRGYQALSSAVPKLLEAGEKGKEESQGGDEELARQLHRAMNNSPRGGRRLSPGASPSAVDVKAEVGEGGVQKQQPRSVIKEEHGFGDQAAVDTQGFPSTYLSDGGGAFPFDILAGFPSHEIQAGVIPGVTGVVTSGGGESAAMEVDQKGDGEKKIDVVGIPPAVGEQDKTDTDVSFFGAADPKFEIPGKWNEDVKADDDKQIAVEDYTMGEASQEAGKEEVVIDEAGGDSETNKVSIAAEELQGTQTATAAEAPDAEMVAAGAADKDLTV